MKYKITNDTAAEKKLEEKLRSLKPFRGYKGETFFDRDRDVYQKQMREALFLEGLYFITHKLK